MKEKHFKKTHIDCSRLKEIKKLPTKIRNIIINNISVYIYISHAVNIKINLNIVLRIRYGSKKKKKN